MEPRIAKGLRNKPPEESSLNGTAFLQHKLAQTTLILEVLAYINTIMSKGIDFETFCFEICQILHGKFRFKYIHIWTIDEKDPAKLYLVTPEDETASRSMNIDQGIIGKAIRDKQMTCVPDVIIDPDYKNIHSEIKSELCVPLIYEGKTIGAINIETDTYQTFEGSKELIEVIAENLSCALKIAMLHKTEDQFHKLIEHMSEGVWVGDKNDCTVYTNPTFRKMIGFSEEELRGKISYDYFDEKSKEIIRLENEKRRAGLSSHYNAVYLSKNGDSIPVIIHAVPFGNGGSMATVTDLRDIKKTEWKLRETENYLAAITQYCPEAIVALNENTIVQSWNEEAERMFGYKAEEAIGQQIKKLIIPEDKIMAGEVEQIIGEVKIKGFMRNYETIRIHKNGKPLLVALTASSIKDENERIIGFAALYRDITIQKKWEHELQDRFEKMQDAYKEMGKQRRYLDYLIEIINMAASTTMSVKQIATFVVNAIVIISKVDAATLRLLDKETGKLILVAQSGLNEDWWSKKTLYYNNSLLKSAVGNGHPLKILDILNNPLYSSPALARKNNLRSALLMPLEVKGEVLGSLTLYLSNERDLNLLDDEFITIFAKQSSLALELAY